jgi:hypothetical protein
MIGEYTGVWMSFRSPFAWIGARSDIVPGCLSAQPPHPHRAGILGHLRLRRRRHNPGRRHHGLSP